MSDNLIIFITCYVIPVIICYLTFYFMEDKKGSNQEDEIFGMIFCIFLPVLNFIFALCVAISMIYYVITTPFRKDD